MYIYMHTYILYIYIYIYMTLFLLIAKIKQWESSPWIFEIAIFLISKDNTTDASWQSLQIVGWNLNP